MDFLLYGFPGACSRVTMIALEEIGLDYKDVCVNLLAGEQNAADYLAINPNGKLPTLLIDGKALAENAAILSFLGRQFPNAKLLPQRSDPVDEAHGFADLIWCTATLHPVVRQIRMPFKWTTGDPAGVKADGIAKLTSICGQLSKRIGAGWWYGSEWSIVDAYLCWAYSVAEQVGFALGDFPVLTNHAARVRARPSFQRALEREAAALKRRGIEGVIL